MFFMDWDLPFSAVGAFANFSEKADESPPPVKLLERKREQKF